MFEAECADGICRLGRPGARWLATGQRGGYLAADAAVNLTVPEDFGRTDVEAYVTDRLATAGLETDGPALLTGVDVANARGARSDPVTVVATVGLSNPAALPLAADDEHGSPDERQRPGTVNLLVGTTRALADGTLATLLATAVEAKTASLQAATGFSGTTSDAVAVGCDPAGEPAAFAGSATAVGGATRVCVRDAVLAALDATYGDGDPPASVLDAEHGVVTDGAASVFRP